jgi:hypothetical protein
LLKLSQNKPFFFEVVPLMYSATAMGKLLTQLAMGEALHMVTLKIL